MFLLAIRFHRFLFLNEGYILFLFLLLANQTLFNRREDVSAGLGEAWGHLPFTGFRSYFIGQSDLYPFD
jgi:hypothetical protein